MHLQRDTERSQRERGGGKGSEGELLIEVKHSPLVYPVLEGEPDSGDPEKQGDA